MNILLQQMVSRANPAQVAGLARFFKTGPGQYGEGDHFLGIKVPVTREVVKACWREVGVEDMEECIASPYHEVRLAALLALVEIFRHAGKRPPVQPDVTGEPDRATGRTVAARKVPGKSGLGREQCVEFYLNHTAGINNWDLVDLSCYPLLGEWLLDKDRSLLYHLARNGKTLWEQRIGMVSTMTFLRHGQLHDTFALADILLQHPHDLIHKAVGWLLREAGKRDKAALEAYLQGTPDQVGSAGTEVLREKTDLRGTKPRYQIMPRTMLRYAIEKFPEAQRKRYLQRN